MSENILIFLIISIAVLYLANKIRKTAKSPAKCGGGCGCSSCNNCVLPENGKAE